MALALEKRFEALVSDVQAIQKEMILSKMQHIKKTRRIQNEWGSLSQRVSASWDSVSAVDEITLQRVATKTGLRGMDALVVQVAMEYKAELITFDNEMLQKAVSVL